MVFDAYVVYTKLKKLIPPCKIPPLPVGLSEGENIFPFQRLLIIERKGYEMNVFDAVKNTVTARQAAEYYRIKVTRKGMACCPFHRDKHPSMKLDQRFHCFGCQADGDVIDFAARYLGLSAREAAGKLEKDFGIRYEEGRPPNRAKHKNPARPASLEQNYAELERNCFSVLS